MKEEVDKITVQVISRQNIGKVAKVFSNSLSTLAKPQTHNLVEWEAEYKRDHSMVTAQVWALEEDSATSSPTCSVRIARGMATSQKIA